MISSIFHTVVYDPLYNALIWLVDVIPTHDVGLAIVALTILVRIIIFPLAHRAIKSQIAMKKLVPEVEALKKKYEKNSPEQAQAIFALYKERGVNPFAGIGIAFIQIPIVLALFWIFTSGGLPVIKDEILYSFVPHPEVVGMFFLGIVDMGAKHNLVLAVLTAVTQMAQARLSMGPRVGKTALEESMSADMARSMDFQMRYVLPLVIGFVAYSVVAAAPLYYVVSNIAMIVQEYLAGRRFRDTKGQ